MPAKEVKTTKKVTTKRNNVKAKSSIKAKEGPSKKPSLINSEFYSLPNSYNQTMVKVLFQTPKKLFVYWEISELDKENLIKENGKDFFENSTPYLVIKNEDKNYSYEIEINDYANSWYFDIPDSNSKYNVSLIRKLKNKTPIYIQTSNELEVPNNHILFEQSRKEIFFKNVKTNEVTSKNMANLQFINHVGNTKPVAINDFYNKYYDEKDLYNNPISSHS